MVWAALHFRDDWAPRSMTAPELPGEVCEPAGGLVERVLPIMMKALAPYEDARAAVVRAVQAVMAREEDSS